MTKSLLIAIVSAMFLSTSALGQDGKRKAAGKKKAETGASCKAPAVGTCAACSITCRPGETAACAAGVTTGDTCHPQPTCKCSR